MQAAPTQPIQPVLVQRQGVLPCVILQLSAQDVTFATSPSAEVDRTVRLDFDHHGQHPGKMRLLCHVVSTHHEPRRLVFRARHVLLHSGAGIEGLWEFLVYRLDLRQPDREALEERESGLVYLFARRKPKAIVATPAGPAALAVPPTLRVSSPLRYRFGHQIAEGTSYQLASDGSALAIRTRCALPERGERVQLLHPVSGPGGAINVGLAAEVDWVIAAGHSSAEGAFGVRLLAVWDGAQGEAWREHVEAQITSARLSQMAQHRRATLVGHPARRRAA